MASGSNQMSEMPWSISLPIGTSAASHNSNLSLACNYNAQGSTRGKNAMANRTGTTAVNRETFGSSSGSMRPLYMMMDADIVAASPATVYRVLKQADVLRRWARKPSKKGSGFDQPTAAHQHWHVDISYLNIAGTFYYLCSILDGYSRSIVHWEIRERMTEADVQTVLQRAKERYDGHQVRIISDNGPQFIARDFKEFIRVSGMTHVRTSPYYPQSNGKLERFHGSIKRECIRPRTPLNLEQARNTVADYVRTYNEERLHSALGYITPADMLAGRAQEIHQKRDDALEAARARRKSRRKSNGKEILSLPTKNTDHEADGCQTEPGISPSRRPSKARELCRKSV